MSSRTSFVAVAVNALTTGRFGQPVDEFRDLQIPRPEILPPLGDAVRLVHRHHDDGRFQRELEKILGKQPLRRHIDEGIAALRRQGEGLFILGPR